MTETAIREFKGIWIPAEIWLNENLSALDKFIFAEIDSLDGERGCYASNKYIAGFCQCSESKVSRSISKLVDAGYIEVSNFNGRTRIIKVIKPANNEPSSLGKKLRQPMKKAEAAYEKSGPSNIDNNTNKENKDVYTQKEVEPLIKTTSASQSILEYLNIKAGTRFRPTDTNLKYISSRLQEKFTEQECKQVIDYKVSEWMGTDMQKYLRPETLFRPSKFEGYLNAANVGAPIKANKSADTASNGSRQTAFRDLPSTEQKSKLTGIKF